MLTLKSGAYTINDLKALRHAIGVAYAELKCTDDDTCDDCPHKRACDDLSRLQAHICSIIATRKTRDNES